MQSPPPAEGLFALPEEVLERVMLFLSPWDLARVVQTCRKLATLVEASPAIAYSAVLEERGYIDVPVRREAVVAARARGADEASPSSDSGTPAETSASAAAAAESESSTAEAKRATLSPTASTRLFGARGTRPTRPLPSRTASPLETAIKSPHTGRPRPTLPTVSLAPWPAKPPSTRKDYSYLSTVEKNQALRGRERRWDSVNPAQVRSLSVRGPSGVYELQEGILLMCEEHNIQEKPYVIRLIPLPSVADPDLEDPILPTKSHTVPFPIADLTMDPTQDLIVVSEFEPEPSRPDLGAPAHRYHLLTLSTFEPHPLATLPTLDFPPVTVPSSWPRQLIQVMGDTLVAHISREGMNIVGVQGSHAVVSHDSEEEIVAWNWKTGDVLARIHLGRTSATCTFCMLTPTTIAVARSTVIRQMWDPAHPVRVPIEVVSEPAIVLISFAQKPGTPKVDQPLVVDRRDTTTPRAVELTALMMPELVGDVIELTLENFHMRPDPAYPVVPSDQATLGRGKPFTQDPARGVMVTEMWITKDFQNHTTSYELFMLRETLVKLANEGEERLRASWTSGEEFTTLEVPWEEWGEENTRLMPQVQSDRRRWVCSCSGYRMASLVGYGSSFGGEAWQLPDVEDPDNPFLEPKHKVQLVVHDFNPYTIARDRAERARRGGTPGQTFSWKVAATPDEDEDDNASAVLADEYTVTLWDEPTVVDKDDIWAHDITTRLPFRTVRRGLNSEPNGVMIDDQRVLTVFTTKTEPHHWQTQRQDITVLCM